jgi:hypothetical protein
MEDEMASVEDAREAEDMVSSYYSPPGPHPYNFETHKRGYTWVVRFNSQTIMKVEEHEWRINAETGKVLSRI